MLKSAFLSTVTTLTDATMSVPKVSIIIPCYNYSKFLPQTFHSIKLQQESLRDLEIILIDDGSTDETKSLVTQYYPEVVYCYQDHEGVSAARNKGIDRAKGDYILFLDADDILAPGSLASQVKFLDENKN
ncbi:MAG: glycosyltransferase family 2 protein, partial [Desulfovibrio sp.]|nr:glycosyltransferase family 2 protein [Desulfovibrio sp.]